MAVILITTIMRYEQGLLNSVLFNYCTHYTINLMKSRIFISKYQLLVYTEEVIFYFLFWLTYIFL